MQSTEYIAHSAIAPLLHATFPTHIVLHAYSATHLLLKAPITEFTSAPIDNWEYNRPPDLIRAADIAHHYNTSTKMETVFYLTYDAKQKKFKILDGIHRYRALLILKNEPVDYITGLMAIKAPHPLLLNIRFNAPISELIEVFQSLNKANPVPDLYVRDTAKDKRDAIEALTAKWMKDYSAHFSSAAKPNKPNVNRDRFMEFLDAVWEKHELALETKERLEQLVNAANERIRAEPELNLKPAVRDKCAATGCWLFVMRLDELEGIV